MKNNILKKIEVVSFVKDLINTSDILVVIDFTKVKSIELKEIRANLNRNDFRISVIKNSLVKRALLKNKNCENVLSLLTGQNLFIFANNIGALIKVLKNINKVNLNFQMVLAYSCGRVFRHDDILGLIDIKNKLGEILNFVRVLKFLFVKFLQALKYNNFKLLFSLKLIRTDKENR